MAAAAKRRCCCTADVSTQYNICASCCWLLSYRSCRRKNQIRYFLSAREI